MNKGEDNLLNLSDTFIKIEKCLNRNINIIDSELNENLGFSPKNIIKETKNHINNKLTNNNYFNTNGCNYFNTNSCNINVELDGNNLKLNVKMVENFQEDSIKIKLESNDITNILIINYNSINKYSTNNIIQNINLSKILNDYINNNKVHSINKNNIYAYVSNNYLTINITLIFEAIMDCSSSLKSISIE